MSEKFHESESSGPMVESVAENSEWTPEELAQIRAFFFDEAREYLIGFEKSWIDYRKDRERKSELESCLRRLHTLKGSSGSVQYGEFAGLIHQLEHKIGELRSAGSIAETDNRLPQVELIFSDVRRHFHALEIEFRSTRQVERERGPDDRRLVDRRLRTDFSSVRVDAETLDELNEIQAELVDFRTLFVRQLREITATVSVLESWTQSPPPVGESEPFRSLGTNLLQVKQRLDRANADLEKILFSIETTGRGLLMAPVGQLFARLESPILDWARRLDKEIVWQVAGTEVELNKVVAERLVEPLVHLLRNCLAHGIETPAERQRLGKPRAGRLFLQATLEAETAEISVTDDGRGVNWQEVREALVRSGRFAPEVVSDLDAEDLEEALFESGLSTQVSADDLAGRGVGMDVVRDVVSRLGGKVRLRSEIGSGTTVKLQVPVHTQVRQGWLFKLGGQVFVVPTSHVVSSQMVSSEDVHTDERGVDWTEIQGEKIPLLRLGAFLGIPAPPGFRAWRQSLVLEYQGRKFAVTCDRVIGERSVAVRPLGHLVRNLPLYAGATVSGSGKVQLLLNMAHLAQVADQGIRVLRVEKPWGNTRVLVVDASRVVREAVSLTLAQHGFTVELARPGQEAWDALEEKPYDLLVSGGELAGKRGAAWAEKLRGHPSFNALRVIILSAQPNTIVPEVRANIDGILSKPIVRGDLLQMVAEVFRKPKNLGEMV